MTADLTRTARREDAGPATGTETGLAGVLAEVIGVERVSLDRHFFDDLGADSMVMARFCARVRKRADLPPVSMQDVYRHPTICDLAAALAPTPPATTGGSGDIPGDAVGNGHQEPPTPAPTAIAHRAQAPRSGSAARASTVEYLLCGALQLVMFLGSTYLLAAASVAGYGWISDGSGLVDTYLRTVLFGSATFLVASTAPVLAKWVLIGRWTPREIRIWSPAYLRFWLVKVLIRSSPMTLFAGTPLYALWLRALGARVGPGVAIFSRSVPVCTDLLTIGGGTVIRKDSSFTCYRARAGVIQTGAVTIGRDAVVCEATVVDIDTSLGDGAQLGHASSLHAGQAIPDGEHWHGSPAGRTEVDYRAVEPMDCSTFRRIAYSALQLLSLLVLRLPLTLAGLALLIAAVPQLGSLLDSGPAAFTSWTFYRDALIASLVLLFGLGLVGLLLVVSVPRVLNLAIQPGRVYRLYGFHFWAQREITRRTNSKFFMHLFGEGYYVVHYLRWIGYSLSPVVQTGANFGLDVKHDNPFLSSVGSGTVVADGLSMNNADFSSTSFRVSRASIGRHNFLGNRIAYPSQGKTGDDCLLGTKVMVPIDGELRQGVGLLGSPSFEIPRSVLRDSRFDHLKSEDELRRRVAAKKTYDGVTIGLFLLARWLHLFGVVLLVWSGAQLHPSAGVWVVALSYALLLLFSVVYWVLAERALAGFRPMSPQLCSIYEPYFWWHERWWKVPATVDDVLKVFDGTPFKSPLWRLLGARVGRRLFDDGCHISEKMVTIGDHVTLNTGAVIQCHSQEDDTFKSDHISIGAGCTLGVSALVHYGVTVGDGAEIAADSFVMKGEEVPQHARWGGNPARELRDQPLPEAAALSPPSWSLMTDDVAGRTGVATVSGGKT